MGHRSWLTPVNTKSDYKKVLQFAKIIMVSIMLLILQKKANTPGN